MILESISGDGVMTEYKFKDDDNIYVQVANIPMKDGRVKIGLIVKGTEININTDNRFYIINEL